MNLPTSEHVRPEILEQARERRMLNVKPAGISAERRHDDPLPIGDETSVAQRAAANRDARHRMQMTGDLARERAALRLVAKSERTNRDGSG